MPTVRVGYWDRRKARNAFLVVGLRAWGVLQRAAARPLAPSTAAPYPKLFVVGCPRSGTTWVATMLQHHPRAVGTVESHAYDVVLGPFEHRGLRGDRGWRVALTRYDILAARPRGVGLHRYVDRRVFYRLVAAARGEPGSDVDRAERLIAWSYDRYFRGRGGTPQHVFVEKTPRHQFYAEHILRHFPEARIVEVVRDGRDVCASMEALARTQSWPPRDRRDQVATWVEYVRSGIALGGDPRFRDRVLRVRYEALRADPRPDLLRIFAFAGLECTDDLATRIAAATDLSRRSHTGPDSQRPAGAVGGWRSQFTTADAELFARLAGPVSRALGYPA